VNFALILLILLLLTGAIWLLDTLVLRKRRPADAKDPWWVEYGASFFPGDPGRLRAALLSRRTVQDSLRFDDSHPAGRRFHPRQQVHLWHPPAGGELEDHRHQQPAARRRDGLSLPRRSLARLHQARRRPAGRHRRLPEQALDGQWRGGGDAAHRRLPAHGAALLLAPVHREDSMRPSTGPSTMPMRRPTFRGRRRFPTARIVPTILPVSCARCRRATISSWATTATTARTAASGASFPEQNIVGKAFFIWLNFSDLSRIGSFR
jgi:hypothetical protein